MGSLCCLRSMEYPTFRLLRQGSKLTGAWRPQPMRMPVRLPRGLRAYDSGRRAGWRPDRFPWARRSCTQSSDSRPASRSRRSSDAQRQRPLAPASPPDLTGAGASVLCAPRYPGRGSSANTSPAGHPGHRNRVGQRRLRWIERQLSVRRNAVASRRCGQYDRLGARPSTSAGVVLGACRGWTDCS